MITDLLYDVLCTMSCIVNLRAGYFSTAAMCRFQSFYLCFGLNVNTWMNVLITREICMMIQWLYQRDSGKCIDTAH
jgi:hypothetical protein